MTIEDKLPVTPHWTPIPAGIDQEQLARAVELGEIEVRVEKVPEWRFAPGHPYYPRQQ